MLSNPKLPPLKHTLTHISHQPTSTPPLLFSTTGTDHPPTVRAACTWARVHSLWGAGRGEVKLIWWSFNSLRPAQPLSHANQSFKKNSTTFVSLLSNNQFMTHSGAFNPTAKTFVQKNLGNSTCQIYVPLTHQHPISAIY